MQGRVSTVCDPGMYQPCSVLSGCRLAEVIRDKEEGRHLEELAAGGGKTKKAAKVWGCGPVLFVVCRSTTDT